MGCVEGAQGVFLKVCVQRALQNCRLVVCVIPLCRSLVQRKYDLYSVQSKSFVQKKSRTP